MQGRWCAQAPTPGAGGSGGHTGCGWDGATLPWHAPPPLSPEQDAGTSSQDRRTATLLGGERGLTCTYCLPGPAPVPPTGPAVYLPSGHCLPCGSLHSRGLPSPPSDPERLLPNTANLCLVPPPQKGTCTPAWAAAPSDPPTLDLTLDCGDASRPWSRLLHLAPPRHSCI